MVTRFLGTGDGGVAVSQENGNVGICTFDVTASDVVIFDPSMALTLALGIIRHAERAASGFDGIGEQVARIIREAKEEQAAVERVQHGGSER
jgi:hypothetical protein